ncbi:hypothetical protein HGG82_08385 [Marinomonas sp. M1K-6]|uniref:Uncharacterized protein n=1 Tax=Marinomonas profundi TaxID=2726122 RepID=A0A847R1M1_9GAMM|nr:hypothetical protein [Marinomonas profundi]NLQ17645.1 hypothetical protein [Marinomonas profundi]UDV02139.1 hypothetical protein J8N69_11095 [Marinomonas profundi]
MPTFIPLVMGLLTYNEDINVPFESAEELISSKYIMILMIGDGAFGNTIVLIFLILVASEKCFLRENRLTLLGNEAVTDVLLEPS